MTYKRWAGFLAVCFAAFLGLELGALYTGNPTLSQSIWAWNDAMPVLGTIVSFSVGFLFGHFFWGRRVIVAPYDAAFDPKSLKEHEGEIAHTTKRRAF